MNDWQTQELVTRLFLGGKSQQEVEFPEAWEHDHLLCVWWKDGYDSEREGVKSRQKFCLSDRAIRDSGWR
jgi:hypothetical protein